MKNFLFAITAMFFGMSIGFGQDINKTWKFESFQNDKEKNSFKIPDTSLLKLDNGVFEYTAGSEKFKSSGDYIYAPVRLCGGPIVASPEGVRIADTLTFQPLHEANAEHMPHGWPGARARARARARACAHARARARACACACACVCACACACEWA